MALARLYRAQNNIPGALVELTQAIDEYGTGGAGGTAAAYVEMAEAERARNARPDKLRDLYEKALEKDPASCDALWGAARAEFELQKATENVKRRLEAYLKVCPGALHQAEAERMSRGSDYFFPAAFFSALSRAFSSALCFSLYCRSISAA